MSDTPNDSPRLERRSAVVELLQDRGDLLVVAGLGSAIWDVESAGDHPLNFHILGAMGSIVPTALGLAIAQPTRRVLAVTGDAEILMGLGTVPTTAVRKPENLTVLVIDNGRFGETGSQISHTGEGVDIAGMATAAGFATVNVVAETSELASARSLIQNGTGPNMIVLKVDAHMPEVVMPARDGAWLKHRFRNALLGEDAAKE